MTTRRDYKKLMQSKRRNKMYTKATVLSVLGLGMFGISQQSQASETGWTANTPESIVIKQGDTSYTMKRGDTLWAIGMKININVKTLAEVNNIDLASGQQYSLQIGTVIKWDNGKLEVTDTNGNKVGEGLELNDSNKIVKDKPIGEDVTNDVNNGKTDPSDVVGQPDNTGGDKDNGGSNNGGNNGGTEDNGQKPETPEKPVTPPTKPGDKPEEPEKPVDPEKPEDKEEADSKTPIGQFGLFKTEQEAIEYGLALAEEISSKTGKEYEVETWEVISTKGNSMGWTGQLVEKDNGQVPVVEVDVKIQYKSEDGIINQEVTERHESGSTQVFEAKHFDGYEAIAPISQTFVIQDGLTVVFNYKKIEDTPVDPEAPKNEDVHVTVDVDVNGKVLTSTEGYHFISESTDGGVVVTKPNGDTVTTYTTTRVWEKDLYIPSNENKYVTVNVDTEGNVLSSVEGYSFVSETTTSNKVIINDKGDTVTTYTTTKVWKKNTPSEITPVSPLGNSGILSKSLADAGAQGEAMHNDPNSEFYYGNPVDGDWDKGYAFKTIQVQMSNGETWYSVEFYVIDLGHDHYVGQVLYEAKFATKEEAVANYNAIADEWFDYAFDHNIQVKPEWFGAPGEYTVRVTVVHIY
ncbi:LysM peptidoglycan-binding domain-containing protein [Enterococcus sp. LJL98]